jgi:hypothetical protein
LAVVQARWKAVVDRFQGSLFVKMLLAKLAPARLENGEVTLEGKLDRLDVQRLEVSARKPVEALLAEEFGLVLRVRFAEGSAAPPGEAPSEESLADYAARIFGGQLVAEELTADAAREASDAVSVASSMMTENGQG